ncbi:hypothetical protein NA78x_004342 [Anatilimnocola sp. NA78]|uniref:hypothetical protein n=1 Tax=Anatilimnocola sp. NA78 TaxID=3415683 RepID=UPI003CE524D7
MLIVTIGQHLAPELVACERALRQFAVIYAFEQTADVLAAWQVASDQPLPRSHEPAAIVWLQSRSGEFSQPEVEALREAIPQAKLFAITGVFSEGEKRSGKPLAGVTLIPWHHEPRKLRTLITSTQLATHPNRSDWLAIHAANFTDYQGLAGLCQSLGYRTIWQPDHLPRLSSEPAVRLFTDWPAWQNWQPASKQSPAPQPAAEILLVAHPRPSDFARARELDISLVLAQPFDVADLQHSLAAVLAPVSPASIRLAA